MFPRYSFDSGRFFFLEKKTDKQKRKQKITAKMENDCPTFIYL